MPSPFPTRLLAATLLAAALLARAASAAPNASDVVSAKNAMRDGLAARDRGDLNAAAKSFRAAFALVPTPNTGNELAQVLVKVGRLVEAREVAFAVVKMPPRGDEPALHTAGRAACNDLATRLDSQIPTVSVQVVGLPRNAEFTVVLDDDNLNQSALDAPRAVDPGEHALVMHASGYPEERRVFTLVAAERHDETFTFDPAQAVAVVPVIQAPSASGASAEAPTVAAPSRALAWTGFVVGGLGVAAGAISGGFVLGQTATFRTACPSGHCGADQHAALANAGTAATVSNIAFAVGGVGVVVGVVALLLTPAAHPQTARVAPYLGVGSVGVSGVFE